MADGARSIVVVTSDSLLDLPVFTPTKPLFWERHAWNDDPEQIGAAHLVGRILDSEPGAVCLANDVPEELALEVCKLLDEFQHDLGVVLIRQPTSDLWREAARFGVRDIIAPDAVTTDLVRAVESTVDRHERLRASRLLEASASAKRGKVIVVLSPKGGSGKTMVSTNLAVSLAVMHGGQTALLDLDCLFGDVAGALSIVPEHTIGDLAALAAVDSTTLKVYLSLHEPSGLYILAGAESPDSGEMVTDALVTKVIEMLSVDFPYIVIDTAAGLDERALAAIEKASDLILVASMDVASIRNLAKELNAFDKLGMRSARRTFVLNRADTRAGIDINDVESTIGMKVDAAIPSSILVPLSMNQGTPVVLASPDSDVAQALLSITERFSSGTTSVSALNGHKGRHLHWRH